MKAIDFFCGAGGLTKGLQLAGIDVLAGIDADGRCLDTYDKNNAPARFFSEDIKNIDLKYLKTNFPSLFENPGDVLFAGCAPCQPFSQQRRAKTKRPDATLLLEFGRLIEIFHPGAVLVENVSGISKVKGFSTFKRFEKLLADNDYHAVWQVVNACDYGVPQNRKRLILMAVKNGVATLPLPTHGKTLLPYITVRNAISGYPGILSGESNPEFHNHTAATLSPINKERLTYTKKNGGDRRTWPAHLILECHKKPASGHADVYGRMFWDKPAPTLTAKCWSISNGRYAHPEQNRAISLREAAAIQTFPDTYVFHGTNTSICRQIGNAVPVLLGEVLGRHIQELCTKTKGKVGVCT